MKLSCDYSLCLVTDSALCKPSSVEQVVEAAIQGGVNIVQLREKNSSTSDFLALGKRIKAVTDCYQIPLIINDRIDIALALNASGAHLGQKDMPVITARELLGEDKIIGISVSDLDELAQVSGLAVDYLGVGPVFPTSTKTDANPPIGLDLLRKIRQLTYHKLIAIGGITTANAASIWRTGVDGIAVVSALCKAVSPQQTAQQLLQEINQHENLS
jgi:thiamine-phosphate pyrophosphorylase